MAAFDLFYYFVAPDYGIILSALVMVSTPSSHFTIIGVLLPESSVLPAIFL